MRTRSVVKHHGKQTAVDPDTLSSAAILDEPEFAKLVHEDVDPRSRRPDHFSERLLRDVWQRSRAGFIVLKAGEEQEHSSKPFLPGVEQLIDEVFFDTNVPGEHVREKALGKGRLTMQGLGHGPLADSHRNGLFHRGGCAHSPWLTGERALTEEIASPQYCDDRFLATRGQDRQLHAAGLHVPYTRGAFALRVNGGVGREADNAAGHAGGPEKRLDIEWGRRLGFTAIGHFEMIPRC